MRPVIFFRGSLAEEGEEAVALKHFPLLTQRTAVREGDLVIGRYSVLPYYEELETDLTQLGATLINTYAQHRYIADLENWVGDLKELTPRTWFNGPHELPAEGRYVLKGRTNSRKDRWKTLMYAEGRQQAIEIYCRLMDDCLIAPQGVVIREYVPLAAFPVENISGAPVTKEYRFFVFNGKVLAGGFYWSTHVEELKEAKLNYQADLWGAEQWLVQTVIPRLPRPPQGPSFYVVDVALTRKEDYLVIELNDGQMSGLSEVDPEKLYATLAERLVCTHPKQAASVMGAMTGVWHCKLCGAEIKAT
jgi:hypothetical protein